MIRRFNTSTNQLPINEFDGRFDPADCTYLTVHRYFFPDKLPKIPTTPGLLRQLKLSSALTIKFNRDIWKYQLHHRIFNYQILLHDIGGFQVADFYVFLRYNNSPVVGKYGEVYFYTGPFTPRR